jgi:hypothetical protein
MFASYLQAVSGCFYTHVMTIFAVLDALFHVYICCMVLGMGHS